jgi:zinc transport system substrate-binding protein
MARTLIQLCSAVQIHTGRFMRKNALLIVATLISGMCSFKASAEVKLVTSIKPLQLIAAEVQDGLGEPKAVVPAGASPHSFTLKPSTVRDLQQADLVYWVGPDLETYLSKTLEARRGKTVAIQNIDGLHLRHFGDSQLSDGNQGTPDERESLDDDHDDLHRTGSIDVHLWLSPGNALIIAKQMASDLAIADAQNAERYQANFEAFRERLERQDEVLKRRLGRLSAIPFFLFHQTFDYFEEAFGLKHRGILALGNEVQPGARHVAELKALLKDAGASCIFYEPPLRPKLAETIAAGLPVRFAELDALGYGIDPKVGGYGILIERLGKSMVDCLEQIEPAS